MSRSSHFVGFTQEAEDYVKNLQELKSNTYTNGMFEEIPLRRWSLPEKDFCYNKNSCIIEVVQECLWSSGPIIFTCLAINYENGEPSKFLQWIDDPRVKDKEYDKQQGKFWI